MLNDIVLQTNLYAQRDKNSPDFSVSDGDLHKFLGIILLSGYHSFPRATLLVDAAWSWCTSCVQHNE